MISLQLVSCGMQEIHRDITCDSPNNGSLHFDRSNATYSGSANYKMIPKDISEFFLILYLILDNCFLSQIDIFVQVLQADGGKNLYMEIQKKIYKFLFLFLFPYLGCR